MQYLKNKTKKRRIRHPDSILHRKDGTCYLCMAINNDFRLHAYVEAHHVFPGAAGRRVSEENGLKVWLCRAHHRDSAAAVHRNHDNMLLIQQDAQKDFLRTRTMQEWMRTVGRNYI